jgi:hypothetical protein
MTLLLWRMKTKNKTSIPVVILRCIKYFFWDRRLFLYVVFFLPTKMRMYFLHDSSGFCGGEYFMLQLLGNLSFFLHLVKTSCFIYYSS